MTSSLFALSRRLRPLVVAGAMLLTAGTATAASSDDDVQSPARATSAATSRAAGLFDGWSEYRTEHRAAQFVAAFQREDAPAVRAMLHPEATFVNRMPPSGDRDDAVVLTGAAEVMGYFSQTFPIESCPPGA